VSGTTVLVTAATKDGSTGEIAQTIGVALTDRGLPAVGLPPEEVGDISRYDAVVLGSAVYSGHWLPAATALVERCSDSRRAGRSGCSQRPDREARPVADQEDWARTRWTCLTSAR
jgi:hypothetical protein